MDLAPFARMDDPVSLASVDPPPTTSSKRTSRPKFNEDEDDDDDSLDVLASRPTEPGDQRAVLSENPDIMTPSKDADFFSSLDGVFTQKPRTPQQTFLGEEAKQAESPPVEQFPSASFSSPKHDDGMDDVFLQADSRPSQPLSSGGSFSPVTSSASPNKGTTTGAGSGSVNNAMNDSMMSSPGIKSMTREVTKRAFEESTGNSEASLAMAQRNKLTEPNVFWAEHREWLKHIPAITLLSVDEPLQMARTLTNPNPPFTFLVKSSFHVEGVRRRYSDFELMRAYLAPRYPGILILALPEKKAVGGSNADFLNERAKGLEMFLRVLLSNDYLRADLLVRSFLVAQSAEWESVKKRAAQPLPVVQPPVPSSPSQGRTQAQSPFVSGASNGFANAEDQWRSAVHMSQLPENYEEEIRKTYEILSRLDLGLKSLVAAANKCVQASRAYSLAVKDVQRQFSSVLSSAQSPMEFWSDAVQVEPVLMEELLYNTLDLEQELVSEMKRMLEQRRACIAEADQKLAVLHKYEDEREQNEKSGQIDRALRSAQKVQDAQKQVKQADYKLETTTKALFLGGLGAFAQTRMENITVILGQFAFGELRFGDLMKSVWMGVVASLRMDVAQIEAESGQQMQNVRRRVPDKFMAMFETTTSPPAHATKDQSDKSNGGAKSAQAAPSSLSV